MDDKAERADLDVTAGQLKAESVDNRRCGLAGCAVADGDMRHPGVFSAIPADLICCCLCRLMDGGNDVVRNRRDHRTIG